jgi:hypothetical protein
LNTETPTEIRKWSFRKPPRTCTVTRIDGKLHQPHRVAQTKQSGWWKRISTFTMDIFGFFQHFWCKFPTVSKFSDYILFSKDGNFRLFVIFRLISFSKDGNFQLVVIFRFCFLFKGWNSPTFEMDIFGFFLRPWEN